MVVLPGSSASLDYITGSMWLASYGSVRTMAKTSVSIIERSTSLRRTTGGTTIPDVGDGFAFFVLLGFGVGVNFVVITAVRCCVWRVGDARVGVDSRSKARGRRHFVVLVPFPLVRSIVPRFP